MISRASFDNRWEDVFKENSWGRYPSEEAIRFTAKNYYDSDRSQKHMLDLGCGGGATTWYLAREGFNVTAIDGSESAIEQAKVLLKNDKLRANFEIVDFINLPYEDETFDAVYDLNSIQHNRMIDIEKIYSEISRVLKKNGKFLSVCLNNRTTVGTKSVKLEKNTYSKIDTLNHSVNTHLFNKRDIKKLSSYLTIEKIETITRKSGNTKLSHFVIHYLKK